jgi:cellulose synthase/poly-beta-1,6-N-acetylglucosamine synthase-like glycosyltransferase
MIAGAAEADSEYVAFTDSDSRPDREVLRNLIEHLAADPQAGASFAPVTTPSPPRTPADVGHNIILSAFLVANMDVNLGAARDLPFLMGQFMVFRREALRAIGGVECADGQLVDDMYLGAQVVAAGYRNVMGTHALPIIHYGMEFGAFFRLWRRWLFFGRGGIPASFVRPFVVRCVSFYAALGLAIAALVLGPLWAVAPPVLLMILEGVHHVRLHRLFGGARVPLRFAWMAWMPWLLLVPVGVSMLVRPELDWRGHTYRVDWGAKLETRPTRED